MDEITDTLTKTIISIGTEIAKKNKRKKTASQKETVKKRKRRRENKIRRI